MSIAQRNATVLQNLPIAQAIGRQYGKPGHAIRDPEDITQEAAIGLIRAAETYDPQQGVPLRAYLRANAVAHARDYLRRVNWGGAVVPRDAQVLYIRAIQAADAIRQQGQDPTLSQIAEHLHCSAEDLVAALALKGLQAAQSLDSYVADADGNQMAVADAIGTADPGLEQAEIRADIAAALDTLPKEQGLIIRLRYLTDPPKTQAEIAALLRISQVHVGRLEARALQALRKALQDTA